MSNIFIPNYSLGTCIYCASKNSRSPDELLRCGKCHRLAHSTCLQSGLPPGQLEGDNFFEFTCQPCAKGGTDIVFRANLSITQLLLLTMYNLHLKNPTGHRKGFFHWKLHIYKFISQHWNDLFQGDGLRRKKRSLQGTVSAHLSHYPHFFAGGHDLLNDGGWYKLCHVLPPAVLLQSEAQKKKDRNTNLGGPTNKKARLEEGNTVDRFPIEEVSVKEEVAEVPLDESSCGSWYLERENLKPNVSLPNSLYEDDYEQQKVKVKEERVEEEHLGDSIEDIDVGQRYVIDHDSPPPSHKESLFTQNTPSVSNLMEEQEEEENSARKNISSSIWKTTRMECDRFNTDLFIDEVEKRPAIWDMTSSDYKDRGAKKRCWEEIVELFCVSAETHERKKTIKDMKDKWKNIRDNFVKHVKQNKSGDPAAKKKKYIYADALSFLLQTLEKRKTSGNTEEDADEEEHQEEERSVEDDTEESLAEIKVKVEIKVEEENLEGSTKDIDVDQTDVINSDLPPPPLTESLFTQNTPSISNLEEEEDNIRKNIWKTSKIECDRFDTDLFIDEVEKHPAIWDMTSRDYKDRGAKKRCWEEIVELFCVSAETHERKKTSVILQKKWKNLRDSYVKELRKFRALPSGSGSKAVSTYMYFKRLQFLESTIPIKETTNNLEKDTTGANTSFNEDVRVERIVNGSSPGKKKLKLDPVDKHFIDILEKGLLLRQKEEEQQDDEDRLFCLSLFKEMKKMSENTRLMAKIEIMNVIQHAQLVHYPPSHSQQYTVHSGYTGHTQAFHSQFYPTTPSQSGTTSAVYETQPVHHIHSYKESHASKSRYYSQTPTLIHPPTPSPGAASSSSDTHSEYIDTF